MVPNFTIIKQTQNTFAFESQNKIITEFDYNIKGNKEIMFKF